MRHHTPYVPVELIKPYLDEYLTKSSIRALAQLTRTDERVLHDIRHGKREKLRFDTADRILGGLDLAHEWYENEALARIYQTVN